MKIEGNNMGTLIFPSAIAPPVGAPVDTPVNVGFQTFFVIVHFVVAITAIYLALKGPIQKRDWFEIRFRILVLIGGSLGAVFFEPAGDRMGQLWYNEIGGQWSLVHLYGMSVPIWALPVYTVFVGAFTLWVIDRVRCGAGPAEFFKVFVAVLVADLLIEIPILTFGGLYQYWGDNQPLWHPVWFPLPLWFMIVNRLLSLVPAIVILGLMSTRIRRIEWSIPFIIPGCLMAAYGLAAWPVIMTIQNGESLAVTTVAAFVTITIATFFSVVSVKLLPKFRDAMEVTPSYVGKIEIEPPVDSKTGRRSIADRLAGFI